MSEDPLLYRTVNPRLKGCPFCGAQPTISPAVIPVRQEERESTSPKWILQCSDVTCRGGRIESYLSLADAETKWNDRPFEGGAMRFAELKMREPNALRISQNGKINLHLEFHRLEEFTVSTKGRLVGSEVEAVEVTLLFYRGPGAAQLP